MAFFGFLRCSEFTTPSLSNCDKDQTLLHSDLTTNGNEYRLHINAAKMDPFCLGVNLFLRRTYHSVCPVKALKNYQARTRQSDLPQFAHADESFLIPVSLTSMLRSLLHRLGYNEDHYASQLLEGSNNNCSRCWPARLADQNSRSLVFRLLPTEGNITPGHRTLSGQNKSMSSHILCCPDIGYWNGHTQMA